MLLMLKLLLKVIKYFNGGTKFKMDKSKQQEERLRKKWK